MPPLPRPLPGDRLSIAYPDSTVVESNPIYQTREIRVISVRDLHAVPLTPAEYLRRPLVRRSRWLLSAWDLSAQDVRQFYLGSSRDSASPGLVRLALYEQDSPKPYHILDRVYRETRRDRMVLAKMLAREVIPHQTESGLQLRVIAHDVRRVG